MSSRGAVVIGGHINALGVARSLAARGIRVAIVRTQSFDIAQYSRTVSESESALKMDEEPALLAELLERRARDWNSWTIIPTNDGALAALDQHRGLIELSYRLIAPSPDATLHLLDKSRMLESAERAGLSVPRNYGSASPGNTAFKDAQYPVIVKPLAGFQFARRFGCKLFVARNRAELDACCARVQSAGIPCHVQEFIQGADDAIYAYCVYIDNHGAPSRGLLVHKLRQSPALFGVARVAEIAEDNPGLRDASLALLQQIGFRGIAAVEFKLDERGGRPRFIEVNGRSIIYNALLRRAGLDLTAMAWADHVDGVQLEATVAKWPGVWVNLHADVLHSMLDRKQMSWRSFSTPYQRSLLEATWSPRDPKPFFMQWGRTAMEGPASLLSGRYRARVTAQTSTLNP